MEARLKLAQWVAGTGLKKKDVAANLRIAPKTLGQWISGKRVPGLMGRVMIQTVTAGQIMVEDWG